MKQRVALVTGSATGLGYRINRALSEAGHAVVLTYRRSREAAEQQARELAQRGGTALALPADVSDPDQVDALFDALEARLGRLDILVNAAGPFQVERRRLAAHTLEEWRQLVDGNLSSAFYCIRRAVPLMRRERFGRIINFGFARVDEAPGWPGRAAYAAAKAALVSLTRSVAQEEAEWGITANLICPGDIRHPYKHADIAAARVHEDARTPLGRPGSGEDVARVVRFLCEADSDFVTGSVLQVTGGIDVIKPWSEGEGRRD